MRSGLLLIVAIFSLTAIAKTHKSPHEKTQLEKNAEIVRTVPKGSEITVDKFDPHTETFVITINSAKGVGPNFASVSALKDAIQFDGDLKDFLKQKSQMVGSVYQLKKELVLLSEKQVAERIRHAK